MSLPTAYTPLETLLLFQALRSEGVEGSSTFNRISDQLKSIPLIHSHPRYDGGRLSPDALRELYLWLLKDEAKSDLEGQLDRDRPVQNGGSSPNSRKRKAPSPALPTVQEASKHSHLIPQLVTRLYARYRENTVGEIREHERRYDVLVREVEEIEAGQWDDRLQKQNSTQSHLASTSAHTRRNDTLSQAYGDVTAQASGNGAQNKIEHARNEQNGTESYHHESSSTATQSQQPRSALESDASGQQSSKTRTGSPAISHYSSTAPPHGHLAAGPLMSSQGQPLPSPSPRPVLPPQGDRMSLPPAGAVQYTESPTGHHAPMSQQHYPTAHIQHPGVPPGHDPSHYGYQPPVGYYQQHRYINQQGQYMPQPNAPYPGYDPRYLPPQYHGRPPPPYAHVPQQSPGYPQGHGAYPPHAATAPSTGPRERPSISRRITDIIEALATPVRKERKPVWKSLTPVKGGTPIPRPEGEPLSPRLKRSELPARSTRSTRSRGTTDSEQPEELESLAVPAKPRGRAARDRTPHSVVSSTADESARMTRSQSVSTAGALPTSDDRPSSRGNVKAEPSTPAAFVEDAEPVPQEAQSGGRLTRKRRGTLQSLQQPSHKRKRQESLGDITDDWGTPPPKSSTVTAARNFHKLSQTIMNDINSHKHASYFANPVRDRDAPGYSEIMKHPQHLKGIRAAISAGSKAVHAAAVESPSVSDTPTKTGVGGDSSATTIELERTEDLIPPKAIVNAAQLEKEVLRMFANAVMFNPGDDGLVADAREMFEDVEAKMREWRGAEKEAGAADIEEDDVGKGKRRKL